MCVCLAGVPSTSARGFFLFLSRSGKGSNCGFLISNQSACSMLSLCALPSYLRKKKKKIMPWTFLSPAELNSRGRGRRIFLLILSDPESARHRPELTWAPGTFDRPVPSSIQHPLPRVSVETGKGVRGPFPIGARNLARGMGVWGQNTFKGCSVPSPTAG